MTHLYSFSLLTRITIITLVHLGFTQMSYSAVTSPELHTESVTYSQGDTKLKGYLAYNKNVKAKQPCVLIVHEWWGINEHAKRKAEALAMQGYVPFVLDMYGEGKNTEHPEQASKWYEMIIKNVPLAKKRFLAAYELLQSHTRVDSEKMAAIGYCFGGWTVLSMAQSDIDLKGVISFHGSFPIIKEARPENIKAKILICHGANDTFATTEQIHSFQHHMNTLEADWQMIIYGKTEHSFTNPEADKKGIKGLRYNPSADRRSWAAALYFLKEIFEL